MAFLPLPLLFFSIALAPGTAESDPSTEGLMFKIDVVPGIAADFETEGRAQFYITVDSAEANSTVVIKTPLSYPNWVRETDYNYTQVRVWFMNGTMLDVPYYRSYHTDVQDKIGQVGLLAFNTSTSMCFTEYTIGLVPHAKTLSVSFGNFLLPMKLVSKPMPAGCAGQSLLEPPFPAPYRQAYDHGIVPSTVACNEGLVLHLRGGEPLCLRPDTRDALLARGYIEPPPVPFVPPPPDRADAGRPRP